MNKKQILQKLHELGRSYAEGCFVRLQMKQIYTTETEPDFHDTRTLGKELKSLGLGGATAVMSRNGNGTYTLTLTMKGYSSIYSTREYAYQCPRDIEFIMIHWYAAEVASLLEKLDPQ